ncbi:MAG: hypothetical protein ABL958_18670, partial [Bdellovibrionia bacterium]
MKFSITKLSVNAAILAFALGANAEERADRLTKAWSSRADLAYWTNVQTVYPHSEPELALSARIEALRKTCNTLTDRDVKIGHGQNLKRKANLLPPVQRMCAEAEA